MDDNIIWYTEKQVERTIANLEKHNISGFYVANEIQLQEKIKQLILEHSTIAVGDKPSS